MLAHDALRPRQNGHSLWMVSLRRAVDSLVALDTRCSGVWLTILDLGALVSGSGDVP